MNKYKEAQSKIARSLVRIIGYPTFASQVEKDFDVLDELVEKATPKKPNNLRFDYDDESFDGMSGECPNCGTGISYLLVEELVTYCNHCGQALDWSKKDEA